MGFYSFRQRDHTPKRMVPPKGMTKWKTNFSYIKAVANAAKLPFRNVTESIITENISVPRADTVDWFPNLRIIDWVKLDNKQLWVLWMMQGRMSRKARPVLREKSGEEGPLWRMFCPDFKGEIKIVACADDEEGSNRTIRDNFWLPERDALEAELPQGKGDLGALGDHAAAGVPKQSVQKMGDKRLRKPKKQHEAVVVPTLVPEVTGTSLTRLRKYDDYVVVSDTLEGLGVPGGVAAAGGSLVGAKPVDDKKRKGDAPAAGWRKATKLRRTRTTAIPQPKPVVTTGKLIICYTGVAVPVVTDRCFLVCVETRGEPVSLFATPPSSPKVADVEAQKEDRRSPSIEVVTPPSVHVKDTAKKLAVQTIADTLDSSNNLIDPHDFESKGWKAEAPRC
ncbi:hypothetical protein Hanom_Chr16g01502121 [Helianthus anomalus]